MRLLIIVALFALCSCQSPPFKYNVFDHRRIYSAREWDRYSREHDCHLGLASRYWWACTKPVPESWIDSRVNEDVNP